MSVIELNDISRRHADIKQRHERQRAERQAEIAPYVLPRDEEADALAAAVADLADELAVMP